MMVRSAGLYTLGDDTVMDKDVKVDYPDTLDLYIIRSSIGVKSPRKVYYSREQGNWRE